MTGCVKTVYKTQVQYISPDIPESLLERCEDVPVSITTNGDLLMSFLSLQTAYIICSSKVSSIKMILDSYNANFSNTESNE